MTDMQTWKIQRPIVTSELRGMFLVYNEDQSISQHVPMTEDVLRLFPEGYLKIYVRGIMSKGGAIDIRAVIKDQGW